MTIFVKSGRASFRNPLAQQQGIHQQQIFRISSSMASGLLKLLAICYLFTGVTPATTRPPTTRPTKSTTPGPTTRPTIAPTTRPWWSKENFPNPRTEPDRCGKNARPNLCDPNSFVTEKSAIDVQYMVRVLKSETKCMCPDIKEPDCDGGLKLAVAVVPKIYIRSGSSDPATLAIATREFADYLRTQSWRFGKCGDDMVLVLSVNDKTIWLSRGVEAAKLINDSMVDEILRDSTDPAKISNTVRKIAAAVGVYGTPPDNLAASTYTIGTWKIVTVVAIVVAFVIVIALSAAGASYCARKCAMNARAERSEERRESRRRFFSRRSPVQNRESSSHKDRRDPSPRRNQKAWFGRFNRRDRNKRPDGRPSSRGGGSSGEMYSVPEERYDRNSGSYYNSPRDRPDERDRYSDHSRRSGPYDNHRNSEYNNRNSDRNSGSFADRRSDRNSNYGESGSRRGDDYLF